MRAAALVLALVSAGAAAQVQVNRWQDLQPYVAAQTTQLNKLTAEVKALQAENATLKSDLGLTVGRYDMLLRYLVVQACASNSKIDTIRVVLPFVQPFPLGSNECPPEGARYYIPTYLGANGPPIPAAPTDDFNRADGAAGANWTAGNIVGNRMRLLGAALWKPALGADQFIEARMRASSTTLASWHGVVVRASATSKVQYRYTISMLEKTYSLEYIDAAGAYTKLLTGPIEYRADGVMRLEAKGSTLTIYYNGTKLGTATDTRITAGSPGLIGLADTGQYAEYDDAFIGGL